MGDGGEGQGGGGLGYGEWIGGLAFCCVEERGLM